MVLDNSIRIPRAPMYSGGCSPLRSLRIRGSHPLRRIFPYASPRSLRRLFCISYNPAPECGLGSSAFARHYLRNHFCFLFLKVLRCFSSPRLTSPYLCVQYGMTCFFSCRVPPFGHRRFVACLPLPGAFRRSLRPSSSPGVQASAVRPFFLNLKFALPEFLGSFFSTR